MLSNWLMESNPFVADIYPDDDPNRFVDCLLHLYTAIAERLSTEGGLPNELSDALWMTGPAFTTSIASYQGALAITGSNPVAALCQIRESLEALITIGTNWGEIPADSPTPRTEVVFTELTETYIAWLADHEGPEIPPAELWAKVVMPLVFFNRRTWPRGDNPDWPTLNPYTVADKQGMPDVQTMASVMRVPLAIGAILRWKKNWIPDWTNGDRSELELSDAEMVVASLVETELLPAIESVMKSEGLEWPNWAVCLLPFRV